MKVSIQLQLDILTPLNWLDFRFKALLSSYSVMCSPWQLLSVIQSLVKSKLLTTNYLSPWKLYLYNKIDSDLSDISRTQTSESKLYNIGLACCWWYWWHVSLAQAQIVHVLLYYYVFYVHSLYSHCSAQVHNLSFSLGCIDCYCYLYACELVVSVVLATRSSSWHCVVVQCVKIKDRLNFIFVLLVLHCFLDDATRYNGVFTSYCESYCLMFGFKYKFVCL